MDKLKLIFLHVIIVYQPGDTQSSVLPPHGSPSDTCNSCCQGPAGLPGVPGTAGAAGSAGIPGSPGNNGLPGRDGMKGETGGKGDIGERGEKGEQGLPGPRGLSGDRGRHGPQGIQGPPGKVGPRGLVGMVGPEGRPGLVGEKGEKGEVGPIGLAGRPGPPGEKGNAGVQRRSAFSVGKTNGQYGNQGQTLTFDVVETNIGNHYSSTNHRFTCQIPGTYVFMFTIASGGSSDEPYVDLVKDGYGVARAVVRETDGGGRMYLQGSHGVVLQLAVGNQVWLRFGSGGEYIHTDNSKLVTFAGFLLFED